MQLEIKDLTKTYDKQRGLLPTSINVSQGELIAIVGHNGAGKSTLLKILATWVLPESGNVILDGIDLIDRMAFVKKVGFVAESPNLLDLFSVEYNLNLFASLFQASAGRVESVLEEFNLVPYRKTKVLALSKGLKQRVNIGRALLADPPLLLLDEPTSGLDFEMTREIYRLLSVMHAAGRTILFSTHRPEEIRHLATRILVLHQGSVVFDGSPAAYFESDIHARLYA
jgi:ABC-type multidrug transport system ATPase subunit